MPIYGEEAPNAFLAEWVECGWFLESSVRIQQYRVPPDGCIDVIFEPVTVYACLAA